MPRDVNRAWEQALREIYPASTPSGVWAYTPGSTDLTHGWKIHASCTAQAAWTAVERLRDLSKTCRFVGKALARHDDIARMNAGVFGYTQVGKTFTFYGKDDELRALADPLRECFDGLCGPIVPFERRLPGSRTLFYRYGSYVGGAEDDRRRRAVPEGIADPFSDGGSVIGPSIFLQTPIYACLSQRAKGGVYVALDLRSPRARRIIIKEGRRSGECDKTGIDGLALVQNEARILAAIAPLDIAPKVIGSRETEDAFYLETEFVSGKTLAHNIITRRLCRKRRLGLAISISRQLAALHRAGMVWSDCKAENILVTGRLKTKLLDLESATPVFAPPFAPDWRSEAVAAPSCQRFKRDARPADVYALGRVFLKLFGVRLQQSNRGKNLDPLHRLLASMLQREPGARPRANAVAQAFAEMSRKPYQDRLRTTKRSPVFLREERHVPK